MPSALRGPIVTLAGGPADRQTFYEADWEDRRLAAQRMGRTAEEFCGWALAYRPETPGSRRWVWTAGSDWPRSRLVHGTAA